MFDVFTQAIYDDQIIQPAYSTIAGQDYQFPFANFNYESYSDNVRRSATLSRYESTTNSGTTVLIDVDAVFGYGTDRGGDTASAELQGTLILRSAGTGDVTISAAVTVPFINENSEERRFPRGTLELKAEDGSRIELTAANGVTDTFDVILNNNGVDTIRLSEPWDNWNERLSFNQP